MLKSKTGKKKRKFRILLDAAFAKPSAFPRLSKKSNLTHAVHNHRLPPDCDDKEIYQKAIEENRFVLTINFKDFKKLIKKGEPGIIGIESQLSNQEIDKLVSNFIRDKNPDDFREKAIKLTEGKIKKELK